MRLIRTLAPKMCDKGEVRGALIAHAQVECFATRMPVLQPVNTPLKLSHRVHAPPSHPLSPAAPAGVDHQHRVSRRIPGRQPAHLCSMQHGCGAVYASWQGQHQARTSLLDGSLGQVRVRSFLHARPQATPPLCSDVEAVHEGPHHPAYAASKARLARHRGCADLPLHGPEGLPVVGLIEMKLAGCPPSR